MLGNGFDRAHGLKTSYKDFLSTYTGTLSREGGLKSDEFLNRILGNQSLKGWVDIEQEYYDELKSIVFSHSNSEERIKLLHKSFGQMQEYLQSYLSVIEDDLVNCDKVFQDLFDEALKQQSTNFYSSSEHLILNFNYTRTLSIYEEELRRYPSHKIIYIHGRLHDTSNPIIFGYGDETGEDYKKIEDLNNNEYLKYAKSTRYLRNTCYRDLLGFIDERRFQAWIIGMSCGLSDRVMLKQVFEHENCHSIRIFYHENWDNYAYVAQNISRHFHDKNIYRRKLVNYHQCDVCPQRR